MSSIKAIEVRLDVEDDRAVPGFYANMLGFEIDTMWPDDAPQFAILRHDGLRLQLEGVPAIHVLLSAPRVRFGWMLQASASCMPRCRKRCGLNGDRR